MSAMVTKEGLYRVDGRGRPLTEEDRRIAIEMHTGYRDKCRAKNSHLSKERKDWLWDRHNQTIAWLRNGPLGDLKRYPRP